MIGTQRIFQIRTGSQLGPRVKGLCELRIYRGAPRYLSSAIDGIPEQPAKDGVLTEKTSFAKAFDKYTGQQSFTKLLRNSTFVRMGDPEGKLVEGVIYHIVGDDLYVDFGGKFHCVCPRPNKNGELYTLGKKVRLVLHDTELSTRFLGAASDLTILEGDATLLGFSSGKRRISAPRAPTPGSVTAEILSTSSQQQPAE